MKGASNPKRCYIDTSAYLELLLGGPGARAILAELEGASVVSSVLLILEARRNLVRLARERALDGAQYERCVAHVDDDVERFALRDLSGELCGLGPLPAMSTPRSLDLVHLRTALWFHRDSPIDNFLTLDQRQAQAARELGLPV